MNDYEHNNNSEVKNKNKLHTLIMIISIFLIVIVLVISGFFIVRSVEKTNFYKTPENRAMSIAIEEVKNRLLYSDRMSILDLEYLYKDDNKCYVYMIVQAPDNSKLLSDDTEIMVYIQNETVDSIADWEEAKKNQLLGSTASSELFYQSFAGRVHYITVDEEIISYLLNNPY